MTDPAPALARLKAYVEAMESYDWRASYNHTSVINVAVTFSDLRAVLGEIERLRGEVDAATITIEGMQDYDY